MAAVVDRTTGLWWLVNCTQVLPLGGAHFGACRSGAWRIFPEEEDSDYIGFHDQEAAKLVKPERAVDIGWGNCYFFGGLTCDRSYSFAAVGRTRMVILESLEVLLELKGRVKLYREACQLNGRKRAFRTALTSPRGTSGGPAKSAAFVPGRILLIAH